MYQKTRVEQVILLLVNKAVVLAAKGGAIFNPKGEEITRDNLWRYAHRFLGAPAPEEVPWVELLDLEPNTLTQATETARSLRGIKIEPRRQLTQTPRHPQVPRKPVVVKAAEEPPRDPREAFETGLMVLKKVATREGWIVDPQNGGQSWIVNGADQKGALCACIWRENSVIPWDNPGFSQKVKDRNSEFSKVVEELVVVEATTLSILKDEEVQLELVEEADQPPAA